MSILIFIDKGKPYQDQISKYVDNHPKHADKLVIFSHYDRDNVIDDYVIYYLQEIKKMGMDIIFISTANNLNNKEIEKVSTLCRAIMVKENIGYDFGAWRTGITLIANELSQYNQLILCNDSIYAPLYHLEEMFAKMDNKFDFWGITDNYQYRHHIQSYFMVFQKSVFLQQYFIDFWNDIRVFKHKESIIQNYEIGLTKLLCKYKHSYAAYCPSTPKSLKNSTHQEWNKLILEQRSPMIKIELLRDNPLKVDINGWEEFLKKHTSFNVELIKKHLTRVKQSK